MKREKKTEMKNGANRLVMGSAQLGMDYGIANTRGMLPKNDSLNLVSKALDSGVRRFDTSSHYGCSEDVLGHALRKLDTTNTAKVTSKLDPAIPPTDMKRVLHIVQTSTERLGGPLDALLLHDETILDHWNEQVEETLQELLNTGLTRRVGISVYSPQYALAALEIPILTVLQIPGNVLDDRFEKAGVLNRATANDIRLMVRSVFLQGLLAMESEELPDRMAYAKPYVAQYHAIAKAHGVSPTVAAMSYVRQAFPSAHIIFGALCSSQLLQNVHAFEYSMPPAAYADFRDQLTDIPENILNPSLWPCKK
nr:aldo/keto reductase [uncultured Pseudodesulfovibrio sp.]